MECGTNHNSNINTLSGYTFQIKMTTISKRQEQRDEFKNTFKNIQKQITTHYENKIIDKFKLDNDNTDGQWLWNDDVVNEIRKYASKCQILIYNGKTLTHEMILNDDVILKDNDNIDVIFTPNPILQKLVKND